MPDLLHAFRQRFGGEPRLYRAPGRVNLIGEHTDYNGGLVMPAAIDRSTWVAIAPRADRRVALHSTAYAEGAEFDLDDLQPPPPGARHWSEYVRGAAAMLERDGRRLRGANLLVHTELPIGGGLSSSAALEVACGFALLAEAGEKIDRAALALACQRGDHEFVGIRSGIMDQFIACHGRRRHALLLDTRDLKATWLPLSGELALAVANTMVRHELATAAYNQRRAECEAGLLALRALRPGIATLRDLELEAFDELAGGIDPTLRRRCRHVISENARVLAAAAALRAGDFATLGALLGESHRSLRDDYEVSCPELDMMVGLCRRIPGVYGARMMGGGFGGCALALVRPEQVGEFARRLRAEYAAAAGVAPEVMVCQSADGVGRYGISANTPAPEV